jgi:hypothetical protein
VKLLLPGLVFALILLTVTCKKADDSSSAPTTLSLMQHKWQLVSRNGEALRYVGLPGDYYNFSSDLFLYTYISTTYDTLIYKLLPDNETLRLYLVKNNTRSNDSLDFHIDVLDDHQFIFSWASNDPPVFAVDSLKR